MTSELTRRDAMAALSAVGASLAGCVAPSADEGGAARDGDGRDLSEHDRRTLVAAAEVLYPEDVTGIDRFVERYAGGRTADRPDHAEGIADALAYLDAYCKSWYGSEFAALSPDERDEALRRMGAEETEPDPAGGDVERLRYFVINDLLLALYASPTGGQLVGIENPPGHPGGLASYQRGPRS